MKTKDQELHDLSATLTAGQGKLQTATINEAEAAGIARTLDESCAQLNSQLEQKEKQLQEALGKLAVRQARYVPYRTILWHACSNAPLCFHKARKAGRTSMVELCLAHLQATPKKQWTKPAS